MIGISRSAAPRETTARTPDRLQLLLDLIRGDQASPGRFPSFHVLCDLGEALLTLRADKTRATVRVRLGEEPCEVGLERVGKAVLVTVYAGGALPIVHLFEHRAVTAELSSNVARHLEGRRAVASPAEEERIASIIAELRELASASSVPVVEPRTLNVEAPDDAQFSLSAEVYARPGLPSSLAGKVLRADLFPLLAKGRLRIAAADHTRELSDVHVFLVAEQLVRMTLEALDAYAGMRPMWRKVQVGGVACGVRILPGSGSDDARAALTLGKLSPKQKESWTFPSLEVSALARAVVDFGRGLARAFVRNDRSQSHNLRLVEFRAALRELSDATRELTRSDAVVNESPESYRAYSKVSTEPHAAAPAGRIRFATKWTAAVPSIDLRSTFQVGEAFIVGSARELSCIDRTSGNVVWTRNITKGVSVLTPAGLARLDSEGVLQLIDVDAGDTTKTLRLSPRVGGPVTGAVVSGPGLPRMLIVSEGKRHICGIDLDAGEIMWRYAARRAGTFRIKRTGRLAIVASGEQALTAIDVVSGSVVWRHCDRLKFSHLPTVVEDSLFALSGDGTFVGTGGCRLCHLDPWSGVTRFSVPLPEGVRPIGSPLVAKSAVLLLVEGRRGAQIIGFDKKTGKELYCRDVSLGSAAALVVDDSVIVNSECGELFALEAATGQLRYRHVFFGGNEGDRPRRLDPVLRSGALFVPQQSVHVVRPSDGCLLGSVSADLVPDLLRVDERCDVYVAEESGHVAAFSAAARLSLVKN